MAKKRIREIRVKSPEEVIKIIIDPQIKETLGKVDVLFQVIDEKPITVDKCVFIWGKQ